VVATVSPSLSADLVEALFLLPDNRTQYGWRKVCELVNGYGYIMANPSASGFTQGRFCTLVIQNLEDETFWGVDYAVGTNMFGNAESVTVFPWRPSYGPRPKVIKMTPLNKVVTTTYQKVGVAT
jgi:hypothetical protein